MSALSLISSPLAGRTESSRAEGDVEIKQGERAIYAARILIDSESGRIEAEGDVVYVEPGRVISCDYAEVVFEEDSGIRKMASMSIGSGQYSKGR